jgi:preprotein translocase subunit SecY
MAGRFLNLFKPIGRILPEIKKPQRKVSFNEKLFWTAIVLVLFLVMTEIPLFGVSQDIQDNFGALRVIFASNRGTLMELGIGPIVNAGLILQLLVGSSIIKCDMSNPEDRGLFTAASKAFSIILTGIQAVAYIISGMYGTLSGGVAMIIFLQLLAAGVVVMLMDELVQKGWGMGSGISLFIMAGVAQTILWQTFSPTNGLFVGSLGALMNGQQSLTTWAVGTYQGVFPSLIGS